MLKNNIILTSNEPNQDGEQPHVITWWELLENERHPQRIWQCNLQEAHKTKANQVPWNRTVRQENNTKSQQQNANNTYQECLKEMTDNSVTRINNTPTEIQNVNKQYERTHDLVSSDFVFAPTLQKIPTKNKSN